MTEKDFSPGAVERYVDRGNITWQAPSNIALVKYWGKKENQIPANPSVSFTLNNSKTTTTLEFQKVENPGNEVSFELFFEGRKKEDFKPKISTFFKRIESYCPYLKEYALTISTGNSFPHSSGIASSSSGMSALALCIMSLEKELFPHLAEEDIQKKASFLARLGSGSACRSVGGPMIVWGEHRKITNSSDLYGTAYPFKINEVFKDYQDTILLVDKGSKQVSSSVGHNLMHGNPFATQRFEQAHNNLEKLIPILENGDLTNFIEIVESEALTLHAMMMSSKPYFILMKPNTLKIINRIWEYRQETGLPVCFTLDAGANVHVLYPQKDQQEILEFIKNELVVYCQKEQYLCDSVGMGASRIS